MDEKMVGFGFKVLIILTFVICVIIIGKTLDDIATWTVVHSGTFDKAEYVATRGGDTIIYFEDGSSMPMDGLKTIKFKKGDQIVIKKNGLGHRIVEKFQPKGSEANEK